MYEQSQESFRAWLQDADDKLKRDLELKATLEEKQYLVDQYQVQ